MTVKNPPLKFPGGKWPLSSWIQSLAPPHIHRVHAYGGALGEFWKWDTGVSEVVNDIWLDLTNFFRVLQGEETFAQFKRKVEAVPFSRHEFDYHLHEWQTSTTERKAGIRPPLYKVNVEEAVHFFITCRMSKGGEMNGFAPISRKRLRRNINEQASAWMSAVGGLPEVHDRLCRVFIENLPAIDLIKREDGPGTLFYLDPPYVPETRTTTDFYGPGGENEMTVEQHEELLKLLLTVDGKVMLSGYPSDLYEDLVGHWNVATKDRANSTAGGRKKRRMTECIWFNYHTDEIY